MRQGTERARAIDGSEGFSPREFIHDEAFGGILLLVCALVALLWANSPWGASYDALWSTELTLGTVAATADQSRRAPDGRATAEPQRPEAIG